MRRRRKLGERNHSRVFGLEDACRTGGRIRSDCSSAQTAKKGLGCGEDGSLARGTIRGSLAWRTLAEPVAAFVQTALLLRLQKKGLDAEKTEAWREEPFAGLWLGGRLPNRWPHSFRLLFCSDCKKRAWMRRRRKLGERNHSRVFGLEDACRTGGRIRSDCCSDCKKRAWMRRRRKLGERNHSRVFGLEDACRTGGRIRSDCSSAQTAKKGLGCGEDGSLARGTIRGSLAWRTLAEPVAAFVQTALLLRLQKKGLDAEKTEAWREEPFAGLWLGGRLPNRWPHSFRLLFCSDCKKRAWMRRRRKLGERNHSRVFGLEDACRTGGRIRSDCSFRV
ncbi:hypothetical protein MTO96_000646 [Rhipicephalus appendiculatus]